MNLCKPRGAVWSHPPLPPICVQADLCLAKSQDAPCENTGAEGRTEKGSEEGLAESPRRPAVLSSPARGAAPLF